MSEVRNDPKVNHLLRVLDEAEERLRAIPEEPRPRTLPTNTVRADTSERGRVAAYILGLRYALTSLPIYRTCYDPPMGYLDVGKLGDSK